MTDAPNSTLSSVDHATLQAALDEWGIDAQVEKAEEEAAEFIVASKHYAQEKTDQDELVDELADLRIMVEQLAVFVGRETVETRVAAKMDRLRERLPQHADPTTQTEETELDCEVDGCTFSTTSERGLGIHQARAHHSRSLEDQIKDVLAEEGELPSNEIELLLETSSEHYRNVLYQLQQDGTVVSRKDPEDGRRKLYRLDDDRDEEDTTTDDVDEAADPDAGDVDDPEGEPDAGDDRDEEEEDVLNHTSTDDLQHAYDAADGDIKRAAERFEVMYSTVYQRMVDHDVHTPGYSPEKALRDHEDEGDDGDRHHEDIDDPSSESEDENENEDVDQSEDVDEPDQSFPRQCHCGATLDNSFELAIHRTEEHDVPQASLGHLQPGEFEEIVRDASELSEIVDEVGWSCERTLRALSIYGLQDAISSDEDAAAVSQRPTPATATDGGPTTSDGPDQSSSSVSPASPSTKTTPALDLSMYGLGESEFVDALEGAQSVYHVQRDLGLDRETTTDLLDDLQLLEKLSAGSAPVSLGEAQRAVEEVA